MAKTKITSKRKVNTEEFLTKFLLILICIPIIISPFFRALYFESEFLPIAIYIAVIFAIYLFLYGKNLYLFSKPLDWAIFALLLAYLLATINAAYIRDALLETVKVATYFLIYILVSRNVKHEKNRHFFLNAIFITGVLVALTGISSQLSIHEFFGAYVGGRIHTSLQYPNSASAYLTAIYLIGIYLWNLDNKRYLNWLYGAGSLLIAYTLIGTQSRGGFLVLTAIVFLSLFIYRKNKIVILTKILITIIIATICYAFSAQFSLMIALGSILLGIVLLNFLTEIFKKINIYNKGLNAKTIGLILLILIILITGIIYYLNYALHPTSEVNLLKNSEFLNGKQTHWGFSGRDGEKREIVKKDGQYWVNITKGEEKSSSWGIYQLLEQFSPDTSYTLSFDAFSNNNDGQLQIIVHQIGPDGNNPQLSTTLDINENKRYNYTFKTGDLPDKERLRIYLLLPNNEEKQDIFISKVQLEEGEIATTYEKTRYVNQQLARNIDRFKNISLQDSSAGARIYFYEDALKIFKNYPLLGLGGGGWKNVYFQYQSYPYFTKEVHNHFLEVLVSTGIIGLMAWLSIWILIVASLFKNRKEENNFNQTIILSLITLGMHSVIDFTFSLGAIAFFLYALLGLIKEDKINIVMDKLNNRYFQYSLNSLMLIFIIFFAFSFSTSDNDQIETRLNKGLPIDIKKIEKSVGIDRFNANLYGVLAARDYNAFAETRNEIALQSAQENIDKAIKLQKHNANWLKQKVKYQFSLGDFEGAIALSQQATQLAPLQASSYEFEAELLLQIVKGLKVTNDADYQVYYEQLMRMPERAEKAIEVIPEDALSYGGTSRPDKSKRIPEIIKEAQELIEE